MKPFKKFILLVSGIALLNIAIAAEMDHSQHQMMDHSQMDHSQHAVPEQDYVSKPAGKKQQGMLMKMPASGKAREAGFDGSNAMESTTVRNKLAVQCAQASRGLIMLDNASWKKCGGKPEGAATGPAASAQPMDHSQHMQH